MSMAVRNLRTEAQPFDMAAQSLKESDGRGHSASFMDPPFGQQDRPRSSDEPQAGIRRAGLACAPTQIVLHESGSSPGATVKLDAALILNSTQLTEADRASPYGLPGIGVRAAPQSNVPENVQRFHSLWIAAAHAWFCKLSARWTGAVVPRLGGENTPRRSFVL